MKTQNSFLPLLIAPFQKFAGIQALSGIVLFSSSLLALILANSHLSGAYKNFWETAIGFNFGSLNFSHSLHHWINDGLMSIFFFSIGLEIKRELLMGELSSKDKLILPVLAAAGGAIIPAGIYLVYNVNTIGVNGWGIPMATDIAFVLGIITLLGKIVPFSIKVFVLAFAIIDDLIAIVVIAAFYTNNIDFISLFLGLILLAIALTLNHFRFYHTGIFLSIGILSWFAFSKSGIHPTIAAVIMALSIPSLNATNKNEYPHKISTLLEEYNKKSKDEKANLEKKQLVISEVEQISKSTKSPLYRLEQGLHPISSFLIIPLFALANAGIFIDTRFLSSMTHHISLGIIFALAIGKPIGIFLPIWLTIKLKYASLPTNAGWLDILAVSCLGGMGFTLSLFISVLAFKDQSMLSYAKIGVLAGSLLSIIFGLLVFAYKSRKTK